MWLPVRKGGGGWISSDGEERVRERICVGAEGGDEL